MSFAQTYLQRYSSGFRDSLQVPDPDVFFIVVIPVSNEPELSICLDSLIKCALPEAKAEIIVVINHSEQAAAEVVTQNQATAFELSAYLKKLSSSPWALHVIELGQLPAKKAGPGFARKVGMDVAVSRFEQIGRPAGMIVSMDADTTVKDNYFMALWELMQRPVEMNSYVTFFRHQTVYARRSVSMGQAILEYEIYLWFVKLALQWTGFPHAAHSLGSAFGTTALNYVKVGGMGIQQSGEDFYFLQKCIAQGGVWNLSSTEVYPSDRPSDRVIFGTGPFVRDYLYKYPNGLTKYSWKAFVDLKEILTAVDQLSFPLPDGVDLLNLSSSSKEMVESLDWENKIRQAEQGSGNEENFKRRIWRALDGFQMIKYLNMHQSQYGAEPVVESASTLLRTLGRGVCARDKMKIRAALIAYQIELGDYLITP